LSQLHLEKRNNLHGIERVSSDLKLHFFVAPTLAITLGYLIIWTLVEPPRYAFNDVLHVIAIHTQIS